MTDPTVPVRSASKSYMPDLFAGLVGVQLYRSRDIGPPTIIFIDEYEPPRRERKFRQPALATFTSERPMTKRQRRRARGKGKKI